MKRVSGGSRLKVLRGNRLANQVYNGDFQLALKMQADFPDGWLKAGGDENTIWEWTGVPPGPRALAIRHPSGPPAGIVQAPEVAIQAGEFQRWQVRLTLQAEPPGVACYLLIYFTMVSGYPTGQLRFSIKPGAIPETLSLVFATPASTGAMRLEIGIVDAGTLVIHRVEAFRLYPPRILSLDEKSRVIVRHVETIGEILKPVRVASPIPVNVQATVTANIRNLTPVRDGVRVYGSSPAPLSTTAEGLARIQVAAHAFQETVENVTAGPIPSASAIQDVSSLRLYSFAVFNSGTGSALVQIQVSPEGSLWAADMPEQEVPAGQLVVLAPRFFLRYARVAYRAATPTPLTIWFQAQS